MAQVDNVNINTQTRRWWRWR